MPTRTKSCEICNLPVSELGAFVKLALNKYAHVSCVVEQAYDKGSKDGREKLLSEQAAERTYWQNEKLRQQLETEAREKAEREQREMVAERERTNRIIAAQNNPLPPKLEVAKPAPPSTKKDEPKHDRFELIELDEVPDAK